MTDFPRIDSPLPWLEQYGCWLAGKVFIVGKDKHADGWEACWANDGEPPNYLGPFETKQDAIQALQPIIRRHAN